MGIGLERWVLGTTLMIWWHQTIFKCCTGWSKWRPKSVDIFVSFEWRDTVLHSILSHKRMHVSLQICSVFVILLNEVLNSFLYINESEYTKYSYMWTAEEIWKSDFVDITVAAQVDISVVIITDVNFWHKFHFSHTDLDSSLENKVWHRPSC